MNICCLIFITGTYFVGLIGLKRRNTFNKDVPKKCSLGGLKGNHWIKKYIFIRAVCGNFLHVSNISVHLSAISCPHHINHLHSMQKYARKLTQRCSSLTVLTGLGFWPQGFRPGTSNSSAKGLRMPAPLWMVLSLKVCTLYWEGTLSDSTNC